MVCLNSWNELPHNLGTKTGHASVALSFSTCSRIPFPRMSGIMVPRCCWALLLAVLLSVITTCWLNILPDFPANSDQKGIFIFFFLSGVLCSLVSALHLAPVRLVCLSLVYLSPLHGENGWLKIPAGA